MCHCGEGQDKLTKDDKGNKKREKQEAKDKQKIQSSIYQKQKKPKQYLLCASQFKRQLESELTSNSKTLKQFIRIIDQIATFEDYHIFISKGQLKIMLRSISVYFQTILGQKDEQSIMDMKLYEPYQLFLESKKAWKRTVLSLLYFLQKIEEGMSQKGLQKDSDFQDRRRQLRQNEIDIWDKIQTIISRQEQFRRQMVKKQQNVHHLSAEINLKENQNNQDLKNERIEETNVIVSQKKQNTVNVLTNELNVQKSEQILINTVSTTQSIDHSQLRKIHEIEIRRLQDKQNALKRQNALLKMDVQNINTKYIQVQAQLKSKNNANLQTLIIENQDLQKKIQIQQSNFKRMQAVHLDQQVKLKKELTVKQNQIGQLKQENIFLINNHKEQIAKLKLVQNSQNIGLIQTRKDEVKNITNQNLLLIQKQNDDINRLKSQNVFLIQTQKNEVFRLKTEIQFLTKTYNDQINRLTKENQSSLQIQKEQVCQLKGENLLLIQTHNAQMVRLKAQNVQLIQNQKNEISQINISSLQISQLNDLHKKQMKRMQDQQVMLNRQKSTLKIQLQRLQVYIKQIEVSIKAKGEEVDNLNSKLNKTIKGNTSENQKNIQALNVAKQQLNKKTETEASLVNQMESLIQQNNLYLKQLDELNISLQYQTQKNKKLEQTIVSIQKEVKSSKDQKQRSRSRYEQAINILQKQLSEYKLSNKSMSIELQNRSSELSKISQQMQKQKTTASALKSKLDENQLKVKDLALQLNLQRQLLNLERQNASKLKKANQQLIEMNEQQFDPKMMRSTPVKQRILFIGDLLQKQIAAKKFLYKTIERHMQKTIEKTKLMYEYQKDRLKNFHQIIDEHPNLVMIIRTQKALVASYYSGKLTDKAIMAEEGLIISLTNQKYYVLNTPKNNPRKDPKDKRTIRGMVYDKFYYIIGNAEVRVKSGENTLFSNFGIAASYFDNRRDRVDALLGEGTINEVPFINYEIHQVFFEQSPVVLEELPTVQ